MAGRKGDFMTNVLTIENLSVSFLSAAGEQKAVRGVSLALAAGEVLALVGESGCGKSVLCKSIMKLLPEAARIRSGRILAGGLDITNYSSKQMEALRGRYFSMVFQDPLGALDPSFAVGAQIAEAVRVHAPHMKRREARRRALELMEQVGIERAEERYLLAPHELSGGMRQRCVIAIAIAQQPRVIFADEPTTALDVTVQAQIMDLFARLREETGTAIVLVSHDMGVVAGLADRVAVMCAGEIVESGTAEEIYYAPRHRYTRELMQALPKLGRRPAAGRGAETEVRPAASSGPQTEVWPAASSGPQTEGGTRHE